MSDLPDLEGLRGLMTLDEVTSRVGMSVRTVRFYTAKGLVPAPIRRGRSGYYTAEHVARLELVRELQGHGFTLAAIERYVADLPDDATPGDIALHLSLLAPVSEDASRVDVAESMTELGVSAEAAEAVAEVYARHGEQVARELSAVVARHVWPAFRDSGGTPEQLRTFVYKLKPLTVAGLVAAYEQAIEAEAASFARSGRRP